jgi:Tol biopolymer transport system component
MNDDQVLERLQRNDPIAGMDLGSASDPQAWEALHQILATEVKPAHGPSLWAARLSEPTPRRVATAAAAFVVAVVGVVIVLWAFRSTEPRVPAGPSAGLIAFAGFTSEAPDSDIYTVSADGAMPMDLTNDPANDIDPAWSPDGTRIAFARDEQGERWVYVMDASGGTVTRLQPGEEPSWSPAGDEIVYVGPNGLTVMNADGSDARPIKDDGPGGPGGSPTWSPDGTQIAFLRVPIDDEFGFAYLYVMDVDGGSVHHISDTAILDYRGGIAWSPDGEQILFTGSDWELHSVRADGTQERILTDDASKRAGVVSGISVDPAWSSDGRFIAFIRNPAAGEDREVFTMRADGTEVERVTHDVIEISGLSWQPVGESSNR